ncbi:hypothetical protein ACNUI4_15875 [Pseudomonas aeruginosa]
MAREIMVGMLISASTTRVALAILLSSSRRRVRPEAFTHGESAFAWSVVAEDIKGILAGVEARSACLYLTLVLIGAADLNW